MPTRRRWLLRLLLLLPFIIAAVIVILQPSENIAVSYLSTATNRWGAKTIFFRITNNTARDLFFTPETIRIEERLGHEWYDREPLGECEIYPVELDPIRGLPLRPKGAANLSIKYVAHLPQWRVRLYVPRPIRAAKWRIQLASSLREFSSRLSSFVAPRASADEFSGPVMIHGYPAE